MRRFIDFHFEVLVCGCSISGLIVTPDRRTCAVLTGMAVASALMAFRTVALEVAETMRPNPPQAKPTSSPAP